MAKQSPITNINDPRWVRAISHPVRIRILAMLDEGPASPVILANRLDQPVARTAYHVRKLLDLGLIELVTTRQRRGATEHYYKTTAHPRFTDEAWAELDQVSKQRVLTALLSKAFDYASRSAAAGGFDARDAHFTSTPLKLDERGWAKLAKATKRWLQETTRIEEEAASRIAKDPHSAVNVGLVIQLFAAVPFSVQTEPEMEGSSRRRAPRSQGARLRDAS